MSVTEHRTLQIVRDHLAQPAAATPSDALARAVAVDTPCGNLARRLVNRVGGLAELQSLDAAPHEDEPFDWDAVADTERDFVREVVAMVDTTCDRWLDVEFRTIMRRLLARVLRTDASPIRRSSRPPRIAAGLAHAVLEANGVIGRRGHHRGGPGRGLRAGDVSAWFGTGAAGDRARALVKAAGLDRGPFDLDWTWPTSIELPDPNLLHSSHRRQLLEERRALIDWFLEEEQRRAGRRPMVTLADGRIQVRGCAADVGFVAKARGSTGPLAVMVALAPLVADPELEVYGLSVPEARRLVQLLEEALHQPGSFLSPYPLDR